LESDNGKEWKINGKKIKINVDAKEWKVDINERVSSIYCLFGSNKYKEAGEEAQRLLQDVETANELINKIK
jgi:hypothetical protein